MITKLKTGGGPSCERSCRPGGAGSIFGPWPSQNPGLIHCKERGVKDPFTNTGKKPSQIWTRGLSGIPMQLAKLSPHADCTQERQVRELRSNRLCSNTMGSEWHSQNEMVHRLKTPTALKCSECVVYPKMIASAQLKAHRFNRRGE